MSGSNPSFCFGCWWNPFEFCFGPFHGLTLILYSLSFLLYVPIYSGGGAAAAVEAKEEVKEEEEEEAEIGGAVDMFGGGDAGGGDY